MFNKKDFEFALYCVGGAFMAYVFEDRDVFHVFLTAIILIKIIDIQRS